MPTLSAISPIGFIAAWRDICNALGIAIVWVPLQDWLQHLQPSIPLRN
jgi:hypothetical protein